MKVFVFLSDISQFTGSQRYCLELASFLSSQGLDVRLVGSGRRVAPQFQNFDGSIIVYRSQFKLFLLAARTAFSSKSLNIFNSSLMIFAGVFGFGRLNNISVIHGWASRYWNKFRIMELIERLVVLFSGKLVFMNESDFTRYYLPKKTPKIILNNGVPSSFTLSEITPISERSIDFLIVARHATQKDIPRAYRALAALRVQCTVVHIGDGPLVEKHVALAGELGLSVRFIEKSEKVESYFMDAKHVLLSSISEGSPLCILEGLAFGCVPVVSDPAFIPEVFRKARLFCLIDELQNSNVDIELLHERILEYRATLAFEHVFDQFLRFSTR